MLSTMLRRTRPVVSAALSGVRHASTDGHVAVIGIGNMGNGMARNLIKGGEKVAVVDINPEAVASLEAEGATSFPTPAEATVGAKAVLTMVPVGSDVETVFSGSDGILQTIKPGTICMDSSTIDVATSQKVCAAALDKGGLFIDAPVSGGVPAADSGNLIFMVGGEESHFDTAKPYLGIMGKQLVYCGASGSGLIAKLCNNMLLGMTMCAVSETMNMGMNLGMDPKLLTEVLLGSSGRCFTLETFNPVPGVFETTASSRDYEGGFGSALMLKDLGLCQDAAAQSGSVTPLGALTQQIYKAHTDNGFGKKDFASVIKHISALK